MKTKVVKIAECLRCGAEWNPILEHPRYCPICKSPSWNKPRKKKRQQVGVRS